MHIRLFIKNVPQKAIDLRNLFEFSRKFPYENSISFFTIKDTRDNTKVSR